MATGVEMATKANSSLQTGPSTSPDNDVRLAQLQAWLQNLVAENLVAENEVQLDAGRMAPASADASFRRYFRLWRGDQTFIAMDAPPDREDISPYLTVAAMLADTGVNVPAILAENRARGFLLLSDLGSHPYLDDLSAGRNVDVLYADAMRALSRMQSRGAAHAARLPPYDRARLLAEMELMPEWFCGRHLRLQLTGDERTMLERTFELLCEAALAQPQVLVHRDYHSRNLMVCPGANPGILDFQDAVRGPVTYDLVSLLKDCYVSWPRARVEAWVADYFSLAREAGVSVGDDVAAFLRAFDLMGVQRHIKVLGIFARLYHRDGKAGYLKDLPLTLAYVKEACALYPQLRPLGHFLDTRLSL
jgi:hypothetical protein